MAHALIAVLDLEDRLGHTVDAVQASVLIEDASALVRDIAGDDFHNDDTGVEETLPPAIVPVIVSMVRRALDNPRGLASESIGDYSYQVQQGGGHATSIYATRNEKRIIRRAVGRLGAGTAQLEGYLPVTTSTTRLGDDSLLGS